MVSSHEEDDDGLIYGLKLSSVGPGRISGKNVVHEPSNMDLAMKLHYIKGIYYYESKRSEGGISITNTKQIKEAMFNLLNQFYIPAGRFRRSETGRPYIKCNDCGARFIEAHCVKRLDEWLEMKDNIGEIEKLLVSDDYIGPDLPFSPLIYIQFTIFKCGGVSMGLSMAHVLGDAFSASEFHNILSKEITGHKVSIPINIPQSFAKAQEKSSPKTVMDDDEDDLVSVKRVNPVGDKWMINVSELKMKTFSFHVTPINLCHMQSKVSDKNGDTFSPFECLCAILWQYIAKIRQRNESKVLTIIQKGSMDNSINGVLGNNQSISFVKADFNVHDQETPFKLAYLIKNHAVDERKKIEDAMEIEEGGLGDLYVYGANLTFVNYEDANFYGCDLMGQKPIRVSYFIDGVGENGAVFVLPGPYDASVQDSCGRVVTVILPEEEVMELTLELKRVWSIG